MTNDLSDRPEHYWVGLSSPFITAQWVVNYRMVDQRCPVTGLPITFRVKRLPQTFKNSADAQVLANRLNREAANEQR